MKNKNSIDIATLSIIYKKYKEHIIYLAIIVVCILIFVFLTIPKISQIGIISQERKAEEEKLKILKNNVSILQNTDDSLLESQVQAVSSALPENKDFEGILNAISLASSKSGASLSDYDFGVGELSDQTTPTVGYPYIKLTLNIKANQAQTISFLKNISETVPLSQVSSITEILGSTSVEMFFYYKASIPDDLSKSVALNNMSESDRDLISTLSMWGNYTPGIISDNSASSSSSAPSPF